MIAMAIEKPAAMSTAYGFVAESSDRPGTSVTVVGEILAYQKQKRPAASNGSTSMRSVDCREGMTSR
jgi:hypothetical protein